jgi:hypothetical protein
MYLIAFQAMTRRIQARNAAQVAIDSANSANAANRAETADLIASMEKNTAPIAATPAALAICDVVPYIPAPEPALAGFTTTATSA